MRRAGFVCVLFGLSVALWQGCEKKEGLRITGISPTTGPVHGGEPVTILGSGFQSGGAKGVKVYFGDKAANVLGFQGDNRLTVEPPPGPKGKIVDITLIFDDARQLVYEKAYTYVEAGGFGVNELVTGKAGASAPAAAPGAPAPDDPGAAAGAAAAGAPAPGNPGAAAGAAAPGAPTPP